MNDCIKELKNNKKKKIYLLLWQVIIIVSFFGLWELFSYLNIIDTFLISSPSKIINKLIIYIKNNEILSHLGISVLEVVLGMIIGTILGIIIASILWYFERLAKVFDPFLMVLNALPKTALAPIMIIWAGTGVKGIVVVALSILLIITIISSYNYFISIEEEKIKMMKSFNAKKHQIFFKLILPSNYINIINIIKINIGMSWIGVIVGEFIVSRKGIGC